MSRKRASLTRKSSRMVRRETTFAKLGLPSGAVFCYKWTWLIFRSLPPYQPHRRDDPGRLQGPLFNHRLGNGLYRRQTQLTVCLYEPECEGDVRLRSELQRLGRGRVGRLDSSLSLDVRRRGCLERNVSAHMVCSCLEYFCWRKTFCDEQNCGY